MCLDYVYILLPQPVHRPTRTPAEERWSRLDSAYGPARRCTPGFPLNPDCRPGGRPILANWARPLLIHQPAYAIFNRWIEDGLLDVAGEVGIGVIRLSLHSPRPLTDRTLHGVPPTPRRGPVFLSEGDLTEATMAKVRALGEGRAGAAGQNPPKPRWPGRSLRDPLMTPRGDRGEQASPMLEDNICARGRSGLNSFHTHRHAETVRDLPVREQVTA